MGSNGFNFHTSHYRDLKKISGATRFIKVINVRTAEEMINNGFSCVTEDIVINDKLTKIYVFNETPELINYLQENCSVQDYFYDMKLHF